MKLLYIAFNNGTDTRVVKELFHLSSYYELFFIGLGLVGESDYIPKNIKSFRLNNSHKSIWGILRLNIYILYARMRYGVHNVYVVDEQCYFVTWPSLLGMKKIIDIFDSFFLKINSPSDKFLFIKKLIYGSVEMLIVTDEYRKQLLPQIYQSKAVVYPNYPSSLGFESSSKKSNIDINNLKIGLFGSISKDRGAEIAKRLLDVDENIQLIMAGWLYDDYAINLSLMNRVKYIGILPQNRILQIMASEVGILLAFYPSINVNNKYASPNKLYDAILTSVPILINNYPLVSEMVRDLNIGLIIEDFETDAQIIAEIKNSYLEFVTSFDSIQKFEYTDESVYVGYLNSISTVFKD